MLLKWSVSDGRVARWEWVFLSSLSRRPECTGLRKVYLSPVSSEEQT